MAGAVMRSLVPIKHADTEWAVTQRIDMAPARMVIRELLQNAIENAMLLPDQAERIVRLRGVQWRAPDGSGPYRKLAIFNRGVGMDHHKLVAVMDLAYTGKEKSQGERANFGIGAKTAGLKASPEGLIYRSCHNGQVHQVKLCRIKNRYGKEKIQIGNEWHEGYDVTAIAAKDGYDVTYDWTEVILVGQEIDHDTVEDLFLDGDAVPVGWLARLINQRFYDLSDVNIMLEHDAHPTRPKGKTRKRLKGLATMPAEREEAVSSIVSGERVEIRYGIRASAMPDGNLGYNAHICLVHRNECYDYNDKLQWLRTAPRFGVPHGQGSVFIEVLLPERFPALPDQYRQNLLNQDRDRMWTAEDFQHAIVAARPQWLIEFIRSKMPEQVEQSEHFKKRLRDLEEYMKWQRQMYRPDAGGDENMHAPVFGEGEGGGGIPPKPTPKLNVVDPEGPQPAAPAGEKKGLLPKYEWVDGGNAQMRGEMSERAARYDRTLHTIRLNRQYEHFLTARDMLVAEFSHVVDQHVVLVDAWNAIAEEVQFRAIKHVVLGLLHERREHWSTADVKAALNEWALSVPLSDSRDLVDAARQRLRSRYGKGA